MCPAVLNNEVCPGIGKHVTVPGDEKVACFYDLTVDIDDVQSFHGIMKHLTGRYAARQAQHHNRSGVSMKEHGQMCNESLSLHVSH